MNAKNVNICYTTNTMITDFLTTHPFISSYLIGINIITIFAYGADKIFASAHAWRVRERTLLLLALIGGSAGALFGMNLFRHKTRKISFQVLFAVILLIQVAFLIFIFSNSNMPTNYYDNSGWEI